MDQQYYNNLFQIKQHDTFWNLLKVIVNKSKDLESPVNVFWYCFTEIKRYTSLYLMKLVPKKPELFRNIAIDWYMELSKFSDTTFYFFSKHSVFWHFFIVHEMGLPEKQLLIKFRK